MRSSVFALGLLVVSCSSTSEHDDKNDKAVTSNETEVHHAGPRAVEIGRCTNDAATGDALKSATIGATIATVRSRRTIIHLSVRFATADFDGTATLAVLATKSARDGESLVVHFEGDPTAPGNFHLGRLDAPFDRVVLHRHEDPALSFIELGHEGATTYATGFRCTFDRVAWKVLEDPTCEMRLDKVEPAPHCRALPPEQREGSAAHAGVDPYPTKERIAEDHQPPADERRRLDWMKE